MIYTDQFGQPHTPGADSVFKARCGIFGICVCDGHILLSWPPYAPDLPEFPGGGIDAGEDESQALIREIFEETTVSLPAMDVTARHEQHVKYFASSTKEFWNYDQVFVVVKPALLAAHMFEGERKPGDALRARWVKLDDFKGMKIHAMHEKARAALGAVF